MLFLEFATSSQNIRGHIVDGSLENCSSSLGNSVNIILRDSACTEYSSVSKPLSGKITNGQFGEDNLGPNLVNFLEFIVNDLPLSINDTLEIINIANSDLSIFLLRFKFELYLQDNDLRVSEALRLLFKASIREGLFEGDSTHQKGIVDGASSNFLDTDKVLVQQIGI